MNKSKLQILYSLSILILVPLLLVVNTILLATSVRDNYDKELQSRAELSNSVLALSLQDSLTAENEEEAQAKIDQLSTQQTELQNVQLLVKTNQGYSILASSNPENTVSSSDELQYDIVYTRKWPVAKNVSALTPNGRSTRAWNVATPILNESGDVAGIVASDLLTTDVDEQFDAILNRSIVIMIISAVAVTILLFNHFRFIGYANLLRKQKELNQTMSDFLSVATHELKAPSTIIKGYISNVIDGDYGEVSEEVKKQLQVAVGQTDRLNELVQDLLNVSRIQQGRIQFSIEPVNIIATINLIIGNYEQLAKEKGIKIEYTPPSDQLWIRADGGRVQEIFTNLIDNAVKYSKQGTITISHTIDKKAIITSVRDNGIGMSAEERERLFQRFYRIKNEQTKDIQGTGLGLWIIKQYIVKMGGKIQVDSLIGSGTEFRVTLPSSDPPTTVQK